MPTQRFLDAKIIIDTATEVCPQAEQLSRIEAVQLTGLQMNSRVLCRTVASLALHRGDIPQTQDDLSYETGYSQTMVSRAVRFLFRTGMVERGRITRENVGGSTTTYIRTEDFDQRVLEVPLWQNFIETERLERDLD